MKQHHLPPDIRYNVWISVHEMKFLALKVKLAETVYVNNAAVAIPCHLHIIKLYRKFVCFFFDSQ